MTSRKNILLLNDFQRGGGAEGVFQMTAELLSSCYEVFQYTAYQSFTDSGSNPFAYIYSKGHFNNIKNIILKNDIDIVHVHNFRWLTPSVFAVNRWLKKRHKKHVRFILTAHDYFLACPNVAYGYYDKKNGFVKYPIDVLPDSFLFKQMDQHGMKFSWLKKIQWYYAFTILKLQKEIDLIVSPSIFLKNILQLNYPQLPIQLIRNPLPEKIFASATRLEKKVENKEECLRLIYFGRVASEKGTDVLLRMLAEIKDKISFRLDIFGTGPLSDEINPLIKRLDLEDKVTFNGYKPFDEIQKTFSQYDAFIMSSIWYENAPLSIVEAAINGLQIIVPNMGGMKELAELCGSKFFYDLDDIGSLEVVLDQIMTSKHIDASLTHQNDLATLFSEKSYLDNVKMIYEDSTHR